MPPDGQEGERPQSLISSAQSRIQRASKRKIVIYVILALASALLLAHLFANNFDGSKVRQRGEPRKKRQVSTADQAKPLAGGSKDPFAARPKISSRNGHLIIESSQDKNIEFRTSGARGSVTLNGHKLDQLLGVARVFERAASSTSGLLQNGSNTLQGAIVVDQYELVLKSLLQSADKLSSLDRQNAEVKMRLEKIEEVLVKFRKTLGWRKRKLNKLTKTVESISKKLSENNCFDAKTGQSVCKNGATCLDNYDSFKCLCQAGWTGFRCDEDIDECQTLSSTGLGCQNGARCINTPGAYRCECKAQFHGVHCTERHDDCSLASSGSLCGHGKCVNLARVEPGRANFECVCEQGWQRSDDTESPACIADINECAAGQLLTAGAASNTSLVAPYPCSQSPFVECINLPGSFQCGPCPPGYTGNGRVCRDIDECRDGQNGGCSQSPLVECINMAGTRRCGPCPAGFLGDGQQCRRVAACQALPNGGCHPAAKCVNLAGAEAHTLGATGGGPADRVCVCQFPFTGLGVGPDGCTLDLIKGGSPFALGANSERANSSGRQQQQQQDDCHPSPCLNGATCRIIDAISFECSCPSGWTGKLCEQRAELLCGGQLPASSGVLLFPPTDSAPASSWYARLLAALSSAQGAQSTTTTNNNENNNNNKLGGARKRLHTCLWSIVATPANLSLKLDFFNVANKRQAAHPVQLLLLNETAQRQYHSSELRALPCDQFEHLDVLEVQADGASGERRRLARFCASELQPMAPNNGAKLTRGAKQLSSILVESNLAQLEYTFPVPVDVTGSGLQEKPLEAQPALTFELNWQTIEPACGGELPMATSGSLSSPKFPEFYKPGIECRYFIRVPPGNRIRLQFGELTLLTTMGTGSSSSEAHCADSLAIFDGLTQADDRPVLFKHCANGVESDANGKQRTGGWFAARGQTGLPEPIVSSSSSVEVVLSSRPESGVPLLRPRQKHGFLLTYAAEPQAPGCGGLYTARSATVKSADHEPASYSTSANELALAYEYARYYDQLRSATLDSAAKAARDYLDQHFPTARSQSDRGGAPSKQANSTSSGPTLLRCEYEIRPGDRARNHQIELDWLEMPGGIGATGQDGSQEQVSSSLLGVAASVQSRKARCLRARLSLFERQDSSAPPLVTFCSGDTYNSSSLAQLANRPLVTSGHALFIVYELTVSGAQSAEGAQLATSVYAKQPGGFRLHYSTRCSATYRQLEGTIITELEADNSVRECLYHLELPENNTISLVIEPLGFLPAFGGASAATSSMLVAGNQQERPMPLSLPDGSCAVQAILMDGAKPRGRFELAQMERQLKEFKFHSDSDVISSTSATLPLQQQQQQQAGWDEQADWRAAASPTSTPSDGEKNGTKQQSSSQAYWQYTDSNQAYDIKEFDVCQWPGLAVDSTWNHMSLMFRLNPALMASSPPSLATSKLQIRVRYRAERACGGILTDREGTIELVSGRPVAQKRPPMSSVGRPLQQPAAQQNSCAWILRNSFPNQLIQLRFDRVPVAEIERRKAAWIEWLRSGAKRSTTGSSSTTGVDEAEQAERFAPAPVAANCSQAFEEMIELYEPSVNRTRLICPSELSAHNELHWTSQSDTLFVRLLNSSQLASSSAAPVWPGRRPLFAVQDHTKPLLLRYTMLAPSKSGPSCGGKLFQSAGVIETPRHPLNYPANSDCVWLIQAEDAQQQIRMNFTRFETESQLACWFDYLEIRNGPTRKSPLVGTFCNRDLESRILVSHSSAVWLHFKSDSHISRAGFRMEFDAAQTGCGGHLSAVSGEIESPNYPQAYMLAADCEWTIEVAQSNRIEITIDELDLVGSSASSDAQACRTETPDAEYLEVFEQTGSASGLDSERQYRSLSGRLCRLPPVTSGRKKLRFISSGNAMRLVYRSQAQGRERGFSLSYQTVCQTETPIGGFSGAIESPGYPDDSLYLMNCSWLLRAPLGSRLTFYLADMQLREAPKGPSGSSFDWEFGGSPDSILQPASGNSSAAEVCANTIQLRVWSLVANTTRAGSFNESIWDNLSLPQDMLGQRQLQRGKRIQLADSQISASLDKILCVQVDGKGTTQISQADRSFELSSNKALVQFSNDRTIDRRSFRIEWRAKSPCGFHRRGADSMEPLHFDERVNLSSMALEPITGPLECLWSIDLSRLGRTIELEVSSDMRASAATTAVGGGASDASDSALACQESSLTIYDGLSASNSPVILQNCQTRRKQETVFASSGAFLVRFYLKSGHSNNRFGRNFAIQSWPSSQDGCSQSVFDIRSSFMRSPIVRQSPNYPDLYEAKKYRCTSLLTSNYAGRLRFTIDELDIPPKAPTLQDSSSSDYAAATTGGQGQIGLEKDDSICFKSGNYLRIKSVNYWRRIQEHLCGYKFERSSSMALSEEQRKRSVIVSEQSSSWLDFHSAGQARGKWRVSIDRLCGSAVTNIMHGQEFSTPNFPGRPDWPAEASNNSDSSERVCIWRLAAQKWSAQQMSRIHFSLNQFVESDNKKPNDDCLRLYEGVDLSLSSSAFNLTQLDQLYEPKMKLCKQSDLVHSALEYASKGVELVVLISGNTIAQFNVKPFDNNCGGEFKFAQAEFGSPNYPQTYTPDSDCHYFLLGSPGAKISLNFLAFDLPEPTSEQSELADTDDTDDSKKSCDNVDHLEVRQLFVSKRIQVKLQNMVIFGRSSNSIATRTLKWTLSAMKLLPNNSAPSQPIDLVERRLVRGDERARAAMFKVNKTREFLERIYELSKLYALTDDTGGQLSHEPGRVGATLPRLRLKLEDYYAQSRLVGRFCGKQAPKLEELPDEVLLRFRSFSKSPTSSGATTNARGFLAKYKINYGGLVQVDPGSDYSATSATLGAGDLVLGQGCGLLSSPQFPSLIKFNQSIAWTFKTKADYVLQFDLVSLQLGFGLNETTTQSCLGHDSLTIFDGPTNTDLRLARLCGHLSFRNLLDRSMLDSWLRAYRGLASPRWLAVHSSSALLRRFRSSSPVAHVVYDNLQAPGSFLLHYCAIKAPQSAFKNATSEQDYELERPLDASELEANEQQDLLPAADDIGSSPSGSCSHSVLLTPSWLTGLDESKTNKSLDEFELMTPNWPQEVSERALECHWHVYTRENVNIRLAIEPGSSSMLQPDTSAINSHEWSADELEAPNWAGGQQADCFTRKQVARRNFVVVHDGASSLAPELARYCLPAPPTELRSTGRHLFVRYVHDQLQTAATIGGAAGLHNADLRPTTSLFKARARLSQCGGQFYVTGSMQVRDRQSQQAKTYKNNLDCSYQLFASSLDQVIAVHISLSEINLAPQPSNQDCTVGDYIELRDLPLISRGQQQQQTSAWRASPLPGRVLARYCAGKKPDTAWRLESPGPGLEIRFHTDASIVARGWELFVSSAEPRVACPQMSTAILADEPHGFVSSPNWPNGFTGKRRCKYNLVAPLGKQLELTFVRMRRPMAQLASSGSAQCLDSLSYLADNEAAAMRYDSRPLRDLRSPISGQQMRQLVQEIDCRQSLLAFAMFNTLRSKVPENSALVQFFHLLNTTTKAFGKLSTEQFEQLVASGPKSAPKLRTRSRVIVLEYASENLLPNEGFLAVYKLIEEPENRCGGLVSSKQGKNLLESAKFGQKMNGTEPHVQCEWALKFERPNFGGLAGSAQNFPANNSNSWPLESDVFATNFLVFQVLEIPPQVQNMTIFEQDWSYHPRTVSGSNSPAELCGLNRLLATDFFSSRALIACGYQSQQASYKWALVDEFLGNVHLRTRNLEQVVYSGGPMLDLSHGQAIQQEQAGDGSGQPVGQSRVFRGMRAYFHESLCPDIERQPGALLIRSHRLYNRNSTTTTAGVSYKPAICRWQIKLKPGKFEFSLLSVNLRNRTMAPQNLATCDAELEPKMDYIELSSDEHSGSPLFARICSNNQAKLRAGSHQLSVPVSRDLQVLFVAGLDRLAEGELDFKAPEEIGDHQGEPYGFELKITRLTNSTEHNFCHTSIQEPSVYSFIWNADARRSLGDYVPAVHQLSTKFLYPKNVHCQVDLNLDDEEQRFNLTFVNVFDLEQSRNCTADYVELSDMVELSLSEWLERYMKNWPATNATSTTRTTTGKPKRTSKLNNKSQTSSTRKPQLSDNKSNDIKKNEADQLFAGQKETYVPRKIGRWCGKQLPKGNFISKTNRIRIEFHSNGQIEGKGFILEYSTFNSQQLDDSKASNQTKKHA